MTLFHLIQSVQSSVYFHSLVNQVCCLHLQFSDVRVVCLHKPTPRAEVFGPSTVQVSHNTFKKRLSGYTSVGRTFQSGYSPTLLIKSKKINQYEVLLVALLPKYDSQKKSWVFLSIYLKGKSDYFPQLSRLNN